MEAFDFKKHSSLFIAGTDTSVGKTIITASLAAFLNKKGQSLAVMKPVESGHSLGHPDSDSAYLQRLSGTTQSLEEINCYTFKAALAPSIAAELESQEVDFKQIQKLFEDLKKKFSTVLIEGAGGLMSPLNKYQLVIDLIQSLQVPVLLVSNNRLGTVNHSLLSLEALQNRKIPVVGFILNQAKEGLDDSPPWNRKMIEDYSHIPCWGNFPWIKNKEDADLLAQSWERYIHYPFST